ncbi:SLAC1 anion channel family protein [Magnetospira sp. QH-2]|uniref:SLAC1 anion channel family protein n=1 Tax=Magnetospira sp. (strain QH-2) TaxID=1288970 RepID=UPI0003E80EDF|nr:SLAC1 anion channel family protein [Magnetospira sp. QH-2]CCQ75168.1 putative C4-dicarboxylate transporter/malic acid transport protein [Magnetospira sp. QH-2]
MSEQQTSSDLHWLAHVPVPLFAVVMGVVGLGLAWRKAHDVLDLSAVPGEAVLLLGGSLFLAILVLYGLKVLRFPAEFKAEMNHPVRANFGAAVSISLLLMASAFLGWNRAVAEGLWMAGAALQLAITLRMLGRWLFEAYEIHHSNPAWFIPVVGNLLVPIAGVKLGHLETAWFFFSVGMVFWVVLFSIVFYRIVFHPQMPPKLVPTLFIFIPPPAVGFLAYLLLTGGELDPFARILFSFAFFLVILLISLGRRFASVPFAITWWAFTFPLDAAALATLEYARLTGSTLFSGAAWGLLLLATGVVVLVLIRTFRALAAGKLFVPE